MKVVIIVLLLVGNCIFVMTEMAVVSSRRACLKAWPTPGAAGLKDLMTPPFIVPKSQPVSRLLDQLKTSGKHVALVTNESGGIFGLVTPMDLLEAPVGEI